MQIMSRVPLVTLAAGVENIKVMLVLRGALHREHTLSCYSFE
jgi:hypothetical protein